MWQQTYSMARCMGAVHPSLTASKCASSHLHGCGSSAVHVVQGLQGQELYLTGGNDGTAWLDAVEVYTPTRGSWVTAQPMPLERGYGAAAAIGRQMFVMGGGNGSSWLQSVMMCNLETGIWVEVTAHLPVFIDLI